MGSVGFSVSGCDKGRREVWDRLQITCTVLREFVLSTYSETMMRIVKMPDNIPALLYEFNLELIRFRVYP